MAYESIKLNSVSPKLFTCGEGPGRDREKLVAMGRVLMCEANGREGNRLRKNEDYKPIMDPMAYTRANENYKRDMLMYCANTAQSAYGKPALGSYNDFLRCQRDFAADPIFLRTMAGIWQEVVSPLLPYVSSNALGDLAQTVITPVGKTYEITVQSNDVFLFQDSAWDASRSAPKNYLYDGVVTLNPSPRTAAVTIRWYQLVGNNADMGRYFNALAAGLSNKILALWNAALQEIKASSKFVPAYLKFTSYNTANWVAMAKAVSQANGVPRDRLMGYGDFAALAKLLPSGTAQDAALSTLLGDRWFSRGFLGTVMGVPVTELRNAYVPGTVNLDAPTSMLSTTEIYMTAAVGEGYAPVFVCFEDAPITIQMDPSETGDMSIDVNVTASMAAAPVVASKMAIMTGVA